MHKLKIEAIPNFYQLDRISFLKINNGSFARGIPAVLHYIVFDQYIWKLSASQIRW